MRKTVGSATGNSAGSSAGSSSGGSGGNSSRNSLGNPSGNPSGSPAGNNTSGSSAGNPSGGPGGNSTTPAIVFITRPDFFTFLHEKEVAKRFYQNSNSLKHLLHRLRKTPERFDQFQNNRDLVILLNFFADSSAPLPKNWELRFDSNGQPIFVDHGQKIATFIDPRLPIHQPQRLRSRPRSVSSSGELRNNVGVQPVAYVDQVVQFLRRPNAEKIFAQRIPGFKKSSNLKSKIRTIVKEGVPALTKYAHDVELVTLLRSLAN